MFENTLRVVSALKDFDVVYVKMWQDLELAMDELDIYEYPTLYEIESNILWIVNTAWYREGGWITLRKACYGTQEVQFDLMYHGAWEAHI